MDEKENTRELIVVDVKHYKKVKKALNESEERYRQLFENVPIGIYRTTPDGRIVDANPALVKMLGYESFGELSCRSLEKEYSDAGYLRSDFIKRLKREGEIIGLEAIWLKKDGSRIHVRENAKLIRSQDSAVFFEGTVEDITASKQDEEAKKARSRQMDILNSIICSGNLAESLAELLDAILESVLKMLSFDIAGIFMYDPETKKVKLMSFRGVTKKFSLDKKYMELDSMPFSQVLMNGKPVFVDNARAIIPDLARKWKWSMAGCIPMLSKGRVVGAINVASCSRSIFSVEEKNVLELIGKEAGTLISKLQTEKALRESEKYYRTLIEISPDIIIAMDLDAKLLTVNQQFLKSGGYFYDEVIGFSAYDFISGLGIDFLKKKTSSFLKKKKVSGSEYLFKKKDGLTMPLEVAASLLNDGQGRPKGIIAIGRDITERKRGEEQLRFLSSITENISDAITVTDANFNITYINKVAETFFGYKLDELKGKTPGMFNADPGAELIQQEIYKIVSSGKTYLGESLNRRKDGSTFYCEYKVMPLKDNAGIIYAYTSVQRDITERKRGELAIEEKNKVLSILNEISLELALMPTADDINEYISKKLMSITNAIYVGVNYYNKDTRQLEFVSANTASKIINEVNNLLGRKIGNIKYDVSEAMYKEITNEVVGYRNTLHEVSFGAIPEAASSIIHRLFKVDRFIGMALVVEGELIGTAVMAITKGTAAVSEELLKSFSNIVSVSLRRRHAEHQLVASEEKFKKLFYISPDPIILSRLDDDKIVSVNKGFTKITGYEGSEVVGKTTIEINLHKNTEEHYKIIDILKTKGVVENSEYWFVSRSGKSLIGLTSAAIIDINGEKYIMSTIRDITERKKAEQELRESKALIDAVVENVPLMVFLKEATDMRFVLFNRAGEELLGHDRNSLLGKSDLDFFTAEQAAFFMAKDREVLDGEAGILDIPEEPIMTAKKGQRLLHTRKVCIRGADGTTKYLLGISEDITERKEAEARLLAYQEQLRALTSEMLLVEERERRRIASELHDQIGQNLALCKLKVAALENNLGDDALKGELAVVRRLLECSIQDARSLIFDLSPPVLYELGFVAALEWLTERIQEQFHIPVEFENRLRDPELKNDQQVILFQVVRELLINMGKHSRASKAKIILSHEEPFLKIQVNDDGVGFDASLIFAPREQNGGFGFFSMRERLNYLGGDLEARSRPGKGSQIILKVPQPGSWAVPGKENS
jgi:PAS domain S-box-containing protein